MKKHGVRAYTGILRTGFLKSTVHTWKICAGVYGMYVM